jgi:hypothetical protein
MSITPRNLTPTPRGTIVMYLLEMHDVGYGGLELVDPHIWGGFYFTHACFSQRRRGGHGRRHEHRVASCSNVQKLPISPLYKRAEKGTQNAKGNHIFIGV